MKDLQQIIDNAPEGATHCGNGEYYKEAQVSLDGGFGHRNSWARYSPLEKMWRLAPLPHGARSLADAKQILELQEQNERLKSLIVEITTEGAWLVDRHNELVKDPAKFVDAETFFNAMQLIK